MKTLLLILLLLPSCVLTKGVNTSKVYTYPLGTVVSIDNKYVHITDMLGRYSRYKKSDLYNPANKDNLEYRTILGMIATL